MIIEKIRLSKEKIDIISISIAMVFIVGYIFLFHMPIYGKGKQLKSEKKIFLENRVSMDLIKEKLKISEKERATLERQIKFIETYFAESNRLLWEVMQDVGIIAEKAGLKVIFLDPVIKSSNLDFQDCSLKVHLKGEYPSLYRFLNLFEKNTPAIKTNLLKITSNEEENGCLMELQSDFFTPPPGYVREPGEHNKILESGLNDPLLEIILDFGNECWPDQIERDIFNFPASEKRKMWNPTYKTNLHREKNKSKELKLQATLTGGVPLAVINNQPLTIGQEILGYRIEKINDKEVLLIGNGGNLLLKLEEEKN